MCKWFRIHVSYCYRIDRSWYYHRRFNKNLLVYSDDIRSCIVCGQDTIVYETKTNEALCDDECRFSRWIDKLHDNYNEGNNLDVR